MPKEKKDSVPFVPSVDGNRDLEEDQAEIDVIPATTGDVKKLRHQMARKMKEVTAEALIERLISENCVGFRNFERILKRNPKDGGDFIAAIDGISAAKGAELIQEVFEAITDDAKLEDGARKNSKSRSDSI